MLGDIEALELVHGFDLLLALDACVVQDFVLLLDAGDLSLDLVLPVVAKALLALLVLTSVLSDFFELSLLFDLQ